MIKTSQVQLTAIVNDFEGKDKTTPCFGENLMLTSCHNVAEFNCGKHQAIPILKHMEYARGMFLRTLMRTLKLNQLGQFGTYENGAAPYVFKENKLISRFMFSKPTGGFAQLH